MSRKRPVRRSRCGLPPERLRLRIDPRTLSFETTAEIAGGAGDGARRPGAAAPAGVVRRAPSEMMFGQRRAIDAIEFGLRIRRRGFNIFVLGESGSGKTTTVERMLERRAAGEPVGRDVCYVHYFEDPDHPRGILLPPGKAAEVARDVGDAVDDLAREIRRVLGTAAFRDLRNRMLDESTREAEARFAQLARQARRFGLAIRRDEDRIAIMPIKAGEPLTSEGYDALADEEKVAYETRTGAFQRRIPEYERQLRKIHKELEARVLREEREAIAHVVEVVFADLRRRHGVLGDPVRRYLEQFQAYVMDNHRLFLPPEERHGAEGDGEGQPPAGGAREHPAPREHVPFRVNVLVDRHRESSAPVVVERNPTYANLFGHLEYREDRGVYSTDHTLIRPGALHRANGGYLVLQIADLARSQNTWDALKRALRHRELRIEEADEEGKPRTAGSVRPTPIPLDVKVVLIGSPDAYYALQNQDEEFARLFKVKADFESTMPMGRRNAMSAARFLARAAEEDGLLPLHRAALAAILEYAAREAGDQHRLSTRLAVMLDLAGEADYWARRARRKVTLDADVAAALRARARRHEKEEDAALDAVREGAILIDTRGAVVGQVNGLSVYDMGDHAFGVPIRITARTYVGRKEVISIDREARLSGAIHDKGALILVGYLGGRYAQDKPLSLSASITFEQSYGAVEGDSASAAELFALLSSLSGVPLRQGIGVTGSVNQQGEVQAVGLVNEKIEGFFKICRMRGLTGAEGVIIPALNARNLMLSPDLIDAVKAGRFHVLAIRSIDEGIGILAGMPAGRRRRGGGWETGSVNDRVDRRLRELAEILRRYESGGGGRQ